MAKVTGANAFEQIAISQDSVLTIGDGNHSGWVTGNITIDDGSVVFDRSDATSFADLIQGTGTLVKAGTGTLSLAGATVDVTGIVIRSGTLDLTGATLAQGQVIAFDPEDDVATLVLDADVSAISVVENIEAGDRIVLNGAVGAEVADDMATIRMQNGDLYTLHLSHDPSLGIFATLDANGNVVLNAATAVADSFTVAANMVQGGAVLANDAGDAALLAVTAVNGDVASVGHAVRLASGALVTLLANGHFVYDPNGAFDDVATGTTATDSFTYTIVGGSDVTVTVTIGEATTPIIDANGYITGTIGDDQYGGTGGDDLFDFSAGGDDTASGGAGADAFFFGEVLTAADRISGGAGIDQVGLRGDYTGAHRLVLAATTLTNVEVLAALPGGSYDIVLSDGVIGDAGRFTVFGGNLTSDETFTVDGSAVTSGDLLMYGGAGTDTLTGGAGNDGFYFGPDRWNVTDVVHGGGGSNDQLALDGSYTVTLDARMDVDTVVLLPGPADESNVFAVTVDGGFVDTGLTKTIYALHVTTALSIDGSGETDGSLRIFGGLAGDTITGGGSADRIFGGGGGDTLRGGAGADVFVYDDAAQSTGTGYDRLLDFDYATDRIEIAGQVHDRYAAVTGGTLDGASFDADLQAAVGAQLTGGAAVFFTADSGDHAGQTFLIVDADGVDGYQAGSDYVFQMASPPPAQLTDFIIG